MKCYNQFLLAQKLAEQLGDIEDIEMGKFLNTCDRCVIRGTTKCGVPFSLEIQFGKLESLEVTKC